MNKIENKYNEYEECLNNITNLYKDCNPVIIFIIQNTLNHYFETNPDETIKLAYALITIKKIKPDFIIIPAHFSAVRILKNNNRFNTDVVMFLTPSSIEFSVLIHELTHVISITTIGLTCPNNIKNFIKAMNEDKKIEEGIKKILEQRKRIQSIKKDNKSPGKKEKFSQKRGDINIRTLADNIAKEMQNEQRLSLNIKPIEDIVDAIFEGKLKKHCLRYLEDNNSPEIKLDAIAGHGEKYYNKDSDDKKIDYQFAEILACFAEIKLENDEEFINILKSILGEEFYEALDKFYNTSVNQLLKLNPEISNQESTKKIP